MSVSPNWTALYTGVKTSKRWKNGTQRHLTHHGQTGRVTNYVRLVIGGAASYSAIISILAITSTWSIYKQTLETLLANNWTIIDCLDSRFR